MHFMIGSVDWGVAFAISNDLLPRTSQITKGITLGVATWLTMMIGPMPMPMSGTGLFGLHLGIAAPIMTLIIHFFFGVLMVSAFAKLKGAEER
jgi:hypothetical protein